MLQITVFLSGAALMALEMAGSRMLAPFYGNSIYVWGSLIGVVLAALSLGYYLGGFLSDRTPEIKPLALALGLTGIWVWVLPEISARVNPWVLVQGFDPRAAILLACLLLFAGPCVLMALVSPWAVRLSASSLKSLGSTAGGLYALSSGGSIVGTLATSFFLIPIMGISTLVRSVGLLLLGLAGANLYVVRQRTWAIGAAIGIVAMFGLQSVMPSPVAFVETPPPAAESPATLPPVVATPSLPEPAPFGPVEGSKADGIVFQTDSLYHNIRVQNRGGERFLRFDDSWQSGMYLDDPVRTRFDYADYMLLPFAINPQTPRALLVGLGGGSMVKKLLAVRPELTLDVAELDPAVIEVAIKYFGVPASHPRLNMRAVDGRQFLNASPERYDVIMLDAFYASSIPFHLATQEFMQLMDRRLAKDGMVVANVIGALAGPRSALLRSVVKTVASTFTHVYVVPVGDRATTDNQNVIVIGTNQLERVSVEKLVESARAQIGPMGIPDFARYAAKVLSTPLPLDDVKVLTDDHAPVDNLIKLYE